MRDILQREAQELIRLLFLLEERAEYVDQVLNVPDQCARLHGGVLQLPRQNLAAREVVGLDVDAVLPVQPDRVAEALVQIFAAGASGIGGAKRPLLRILSLLHQPVQEVLIDDRRGGEVEIGLREAVFAVVAAVAEPAEPLHAVLLAAGIDLFVQAAGHTHISVDFIS